MPTADIVFRNATLIDGTGAARREADVAVAGGLIEKIGAAGSLGDGRETVDLAGMVLAPGFVDVHTHDDSALIENPTMAMKASQGVTTVVCGNCGASTSPYRPKGELPHFLQLIAKRKENLTRTFAEFADKVAAARPSINGAFLIGHATLRMSAMGDDLKRVATKAEIAEMREMLDEALGQGAIGMSSGLFYPVARAASTDEVAETAAPLGKHGAVYTAHMRDEADHILAAMDETFEIGRRAGAPVIVSHHKCSSKQNFGRMSETLPKFEAAMKTQDISFDVYPYVAGSTILQREMVDRAEKTMVTWSDAIPSAGGRDLADVARELGLSVHDAADRLQPAGAIYFMMSEDDVRKALSHPKAMIGSDGLPLDKHPHPRLWGTFPRVLGHYSRDLGLFPLEDAVRRMTSLSARNFRLGRRGQIREGWHADLCAFDPKTVIDTATFENPIQPAKGILMTLVAGQPVWRDGKSTAARPGKVLKLQDLQKEAA